MDHEILRSMDQGYWHEAMARVNALPDHQLHHLLGALVEATPPELLERCLDRARNYHPRDYVAGSPVHIRPGQT